MLRALFLRSLGVLTMCGVAACGSPAASSSSPREAMDELNQPWNIDPALVGRDLVETIGNLPSAGQVSRPVWYGSYWPLPAGGTARRPQSGGLSPLEKYDRVAGNGSAATSWELESVRNNQVSWSGHCNGLAAAALMEAEPKRAVAYRGVTFGVDDLKALLIESWQGSGRIVGRRCNQDDPSEDASGRPTDAGCRDVNPATLHLAVTNFIGRKGEGLIVDQSRDVEVWNYAIKAYDLSLRGVTAAQAASLAGAGGDAWIYNPEAVHFAEVRLRLTDAADHRKEYRYVLEGDAAGRIIGGEWIGASKRDHPDFVWRPGQRRPGNPHVDYAIVRDILAQAQ